MPSIYSLGVSGASTAVSKERFLSEACIGLPVASLASAVTVTTTIIRYLNDGIVTW